MPALSPTALATAWPSVMPMSSTVWWPSMCRSPLASIVEVDQAVARDLVEHVVEETDAGGELGRAAAVEVEPHADLGFLGVARDFGGAVVVTALLAGRLSSHHGFPRACRRSGAGSWPAAGAAPATFLTSTPRAFRPSKTRVGASGTRTSNMLASLGNTVDAGQRRQRRAPARSRSARSSRRLRVAAPSACSSANSAASR